jgi:hypothetical protein
MEPVDEVKQAEVNLRLAEEELEAAHIEEKDALKHVEQAIEELEQAGRHPGVAILVNGEPHEETECRISFEQVVKIM